MFADNFSQLAVVAGHLLRLSRIAGICGPCRMEHVKPCRISIKNAKAHFAQQFDLVGIVVKDSCFNTVGPQKPADGAAEGAETGNNDTV